MTTKASNEGEIPGRLIGRDLGGRKIPGRLIDRDLG